MIPLVKGQVMLPIAQRLFHALPLLDSLGPNTPTFPQSFIFATLSGLRHTQTAVFEVIKNPQTNSPRREDHIRHAELGTSEERAIRIGVFDERDKRVEKFASGRLEGVGLRCRVLEEAVVCRDDARCDLGFVSK
jgi:hypothetical protein